MAALVCIAGVLAVIPGSRSGGESPSAASVAVQAESTDQVQVVTSTLSARKNPSITVQVGTPVKWVIDAPSGSINGCNYRMLLRE